MYSALFHVCGIAILEICFYFYYIGPMETVIFTDKVERLAREPLNMLDPPTTTPMPTVISSITGSLPFSLEQNPISDAINISDIILPLSDNNSTETEDNLLDRLKKERDDAIDKRNEKNDKLFILIIEYWAIMVSISFCIFVIIKYYKHYKKLEKKNGIIDVPSTELDEESLELVNLEGYRRSSIDDEHLEENSKKNKKCTKIGYKIGHYVIFGGCILCFQYLFFQNIVLVYDPLSIEEVKYIVYKELYPKYEEWKNLLVL